MALESEGKVSYRSGEEEPVDFIFIGQEGIQQNRQVTAAIDQSTPQSAAFVEPVIGRIGAKNKQ